jgi:hypothetical protein
MNLFKKKPKPIITNNVNDIKWNNRCFTRDDLNHAFIAGARSTSPGASYPTFMDWFNKYLKDINK